MYQFFRGRKLNLMIMRRVSRALEDALKPTDKEYTWLGGYIGFKGKYELESADVEATLTLLPRHALLYFPISLVINRSDRLYIVVRGRIDMGEIHMFGKRRIMSRSERRELGELDLEEMDGFSFSGARAEAEELIRILALESRTLFHLYAKKDYLFISMDPKGSAKLEGVRAMLSQ
jgi:hypothetical protein